MKRSAQDKFVILYDTAKKCLLILDHLYADFENGTLQAREAVKVENDPSIVTKIYISALGLIDYFHRFNEIISAMTLIRKDTPHIKKLNRAIGPVKDCRNYLQHMRSDLMKGGPIQYPILGAISWVHEGRNYTLFPHQPTQGVNLPSIAFDTFAGKYVSKYLLIVGGHEIQLDTVYAEVKAFWRWLDKVVVIEPPQIKDYLWGKPMILYSEFKKTLTPGSS
jgi:hypothetical protein